MLEKVGDKDIIVRNYTDNFNIKEYIQDVLIPKAFPNIPMNRLNLGFTGIVSEYMSQVIEDTQASTALLANEAFITKAVLPDSVYAEASVYNLGYRFATPSKCSFALEINLSQLIEFSEIVQNSSTKRYKLDKNTELVIGDYMYHLDYDIYIDWVVINGKRVFNVYYNIEETNSISTLTNRYIKHQVSATGWMILFLELMQFERITDEASITDNLITTNSDIELSWSDEIAGLDLVYITPQGQRQPMKLKNKYTSPEITPFVWYSFTDDNSLLLSFSSRDSYWIPEFNSKIEYTIYTCAGEDGDFVSYSDYTAIPVITNGEKYSYNAETQMTAICYSGSHGGKNRGDLEELRSDVILAKNTVNVLTTDNDLNIWFEKLGKRNGSKSTFFKRRDDPCGRLYAQFIAITENNYTFPTNTLSITVSQEQFDFINSDNSGINNEFIINPGHIWEYDDHGDDISRSTVRMVMVDDKPAMITDDILPTVNESRPFMFVNPFYIKIYREPTTSAIYNYLINDVSWPETDSINTDSFYQFQLGQFTIERTLSHKHNNMYHIEVVCVPVINEEGNMKYIKGYGEDYPIINNNLRMILTFKTEIHGETGYVELIPSKARENGGYIFETDIAVYDNIRSDGTIKIDLDRSPNVKSLIVDGANKDCVFMDATETKFNFLTLIKNVDDTDVIFNDLSFTGYTITNRFRNNYRDLNLYKLLGMMRSTITFSGSNNDYTINMSLIPLLKYDLPLDDAKMTYFNQAFANQYLAIEPVLSQLNGNDYIDMKLYNTYGRSRNYYIGPKDDDPVLRNSDIILDNIYVKIKLTISVYDRSLYTQTVNSIISDLISIFNNINENKEADIHVSDIIHSIRTNNPNVKYIRFLGFNNYDANKQSIFVKYTDISELNHEDMAIHVPEIIRVDESSIEITEEI